jgi:phosphodiesterase/alkaline phosphatase D-like protein
MIKFYLKRVLLLAVLIFTVSTVFSQVPVVSFDSEWKYWANTAANAPAAAWKGGAAFDDAAWSSGSGKFGFGDDEEDVCIPAGCGSGCVPGSCGTKFMTTYFRKTVAINKSQYSAFRINLIRDDGAVIYVNGTEVWRSNMNSGTVVYSTAAQTTVPEADENRIYTSPAIPTTAFVEGQNVIAVEIHQENTSSSDLGFNMELTGDPVGATLLAAGSSWKYWANTAANAPAETWKSAAAFDDAAWTAGNAKFGYGDGQTTCVPGGCGTLCNPGNCTNKFTTTYFRTTVNIANPAAYQAFFIKLLRDDGAVVYINGTEVWRTNMRFGPVNYSTFADSVVPDGTLEETFYTSPLIPTSLLTAGTNLIAVEIHQANLNTSDMGFDLSLHGLESYTFSNETVYMWSGAIAPNSAKVNAKLQNKTSRARLVASTNSSLTSPLYGDYAAADTWNNNVAAMSISGLTPNTKYYYAIEADGIVDNSADDIGSFTTPGTGGYSFKFSAGGCMQSSNHPIFDRMSEKSPLFHLSHGDFHYANPNSSTDVNVHRNPYESNMLSQTPSRNFFKNHALAYVWDDHDFSGNDSDSTAAGKSNARRAYQEYVPHYPLAAGAGDVPIYQAFTIGRIRFIMSDLRSSRRTPTMMGVAQKAWFKNEVVNAKNNNQIIAWVTSVSYGGNQADNWGGYSAERTELANFFRDNNIENMFILSGDAHMLAIDNGNNHDFSTGTNNGNRYPVFATAPMNQSGSVKGGLYNVRSDGTVDPTPGATYTYTPATSTTGQYGMIEVTDNGSTQVTIKFTGYRVTNAGVESQLTEFSFARTLNLVFPVKISEFNVSKSNGDGHAKLTWKAEEADDCAHFVVERSADGVNFSSIATIPCNASSTQLYKYEDEGTMNGANYYRVRAVSISGNIIITPVKRIDFESMLSLVLSPNPVKTTLNIVIDNVATPKQSVYAIYDLQMRKLAQGTVTLRAGRNQVVYDARNLRAGTYIFRIDFQGNQVTKKFVVE